MIPKLVQNARLDRKVNFSEAFASRSSFRCSANSSDAWGGCEASSGGNASETLARQRITPSHILDLQDEG